jgi:hypothetical protein
MRAIEKPQVSKTARPGAPGFSGALCVELTDRSE